MAAGGVPLYNLDRILETYPVVMHGVCMSLGAPGELDNLALSSLTLIADPRLLYRNLGGGRFEDVSVVAGLTEKASSRGAAFADFDNDGDVDVLIMNMNGGPALLRNESRSGNGWLQVRLSGQAMGAVVTVTAGGRSQAQTLTSQSSFLSHNGRRLSFGLGSAKGAEKVKVVWPDGRTTERLDVAGNQVLTLEAGK